MYIGSPLYGFMTNCLKWITNNFYDYTKITGYLVSLVCFAIVRYIGFIVENN